MHGLSGIQSGASSGEGRRVEPGPPLTRKPGPKPVTYTVTVIGRTWEGYESDYEYTFDGDHVPEENEIRNKASDFQSVMDYQIDRVIVRTERNGSKVTTIRMVETIVEFKA